MTCENSDHARPAPAIVRLSWPDGHRQPMAACVSDLQWHVRDSIDHGRAVLVEPITRAC